MVGVYPVDLQRLGFDVTAIEGDDVCRVALDGLQLAILINVQQNGSDLKQGIIALVESAGFHVHDNRQVASEAFTEGLGFSGLVHVR